MPNRRSHRHLPRTKPMLIEECEVPENSVLPRSVVAAAYFRDSYRTGLTKPEASVVDIFFSVFGHHPMWIKQLLIFRNRLASACGLEAPTQAEILECPRKPDYAVGQKIGPWPIFSISDTELVAGRNNKHLDFRLSVLREGSGTGTMTVISTVCSTHNTFGKIYLRFIAPFHKWGVRHLIARAHTAGRL